MKDFLQKNEVAGRIAKVADIPVYRRLLSLKGSPMAGRISLDDKQLAFDLVYTLLDDMAEADILAAAAGPAPSPSPEEAPQKVSGNFADARKIVKKKSTSSRNTPASAGTVSTTRTSGLRTVFSRTASAFGQGFARLRGLFMTGGSPDKP